MSYRQTVYYYIPGLTKKIYELNEYNNQQLHQYRWILERLEGCIQTIETQYGFEPIKAEPEKKFGMAPVFSEPVNQVHFEKSVDLYEPYRMYESSCLVPCDEKEILFLYGTTNMLASNNQMVKKQHFDEYGKRLKRIEDFKEDGIIKPFPKNGKRR